MHLMLYPAHIGVHTPVWTVTLQQAAFMPDVNPVANPAEQAAALHAPPVPVETLWRNPAEQAAALHALGPDYQSTFSAAESSAVLDQAGRAAGALVEGRDALGPRLLAAYNAQVPCRKL